MVLLFTVAVAAVDVLSKIPRKPTLVPVPLIVIAPMLLLEIVLELDEKS